MEGRRTAKAHARKKRFAVGCVRDGTIPHLYPLPVGDWVCSKCKPVAGATVQVEDDADDAEDEASSTKKAIKKKPAKRKLAEGAPDGVLSDGVRRYRRGTAN